jgi:hypothetical protein
LIVLSAQRVEEQVNRELVILSRFGTNGGKGIKYPEKVRYY